MLSYSSCTSSEPGKEAVIESDLAYDVGMHLGEDTAYFLAKGMRVVAFEAHPDHVAHNKYRFADEIQDGRLRIVEGAITESGSGEVTFYVHPEVSEWGTTDEAWVQRNMARGDSRPITVPAVNFARVLRDAGVPLYMKVDIEGADRVCLEALRDLPSRPRFVSIESSKTSLDDIRAEFALLESLGYNRFVVSQQAHNGGKTITTTGLDGSALTYTFDATASGGFGSDLHRWTDRRRATMLYRLIFFGYWLVGDTGILRRPPLGDRVLSKLAGYLPFALPGWYDTHARLADDR